MDHNVMTEPFKQLLEEAQTEARDLLQVFSDPPQRIKTICQFVLALTPEILENHKIAHDPTPKRDYDLLIEQLCEKVSKWAQLSGVVIKENVMEESTLRITLSDPGHELDGSLSLTATIRTENLMSQIQGAIPSIKE